MHFVEIELSLDEFVDQGGDHVLLLLHLVRTGVERLVMSQYCLKGPFGEHFIILQGRLLQDKDFVDQCFLDLVSFVVI